MRARRDGGQVSGRPELLDGKERAGGSCHSRRPMTICTQSSSHRARSLRASFPRFERAPSGDMVRGRLIVIIIIQHTQLLSHRHHRLANHIWPAIDQISRAMPDQIRPSMTTHRRRRIERSVIDHQSSITVGRRPGVIKTMDERPSYAHNHRSADGSLAVDRRSLIIVDPQTPIASH